MKIYTKTGDKGETGLIGGRRVPKNEAHVAAYGDVDECNCVLGLVDAPALRQELAAVQGELFVVGAILAGEKSLVPADAVKRLERHIDLMTEELPPLKNFILPGGGKAGAALHLARAVCRRAERSVVALPDPRPDVIIYLNRLSDWLFVAARWVNMKEGRAETVWEGL